ncbi:MAG: S8 family serine peptidase, partial [Solirubrobacteraceae bacterium]
MKRASNVVIVTLLAALAWAPANALAVGYEADTVIVKYADGASTSQRTLAGRLAGVLGRLGDIAGIGAQVVRVSGDPAAAAARLNRSGAVLYAEPNYIYRASAAPNDPRFGEQYGLDNSGQGGGLVDADLDAPEAWNAAPYVGFPQPLTGAKIGIVDTGVVAGHEDLAGKVVNCGGVRSFGLLGLPILADPTIVAGRCVDDNGHGTHVAGSAAAYANNGRGIAGVSFNSPLAVCKALDRNGAGSLAGVANCIVWLAQQGAKVISMSLGASAGSTTLQNAIATASRTALVVAAAGNTGASALQYP